MAGAVQQHGFLFLQVAIIVYPGIFMGAMKVNLLLHIHNKQASPGLSASCQRFCANLPRVYENGFLGVV